MLVSVMMPVTYFRGVASNVGFITLMLSGAVCWQPTCVTSSGLRSSIVTLAALHVRSKVLFGAAT